MSAEDYVVATVAMNGGKLVGRTRLQKTIYLLEQLGMGGKFDYTYYNYGPYSREVSEATEFSVIVDRLDEQEKDGFHGVPYFVLQTDEAAPEGLGDLLKEDAEQYLGVMDKFSSIVLELAATIAYLKDIGFKDDEVADKVVELKPAKATPDKLRAANELLGELGL